MNLYTDRRTSFVDHWSGMRARQRRRFQQLRRKWRATTSRRPRHAVSADWMRQNLFSSPLNAALTLGCLLLVAWAVPPLIRFFLLDAIWSGADRDACHEVQRPRRCWAFVRVWFSYFVYGFYPAGERWRVDLFFAALAFGLVWLGWLKAPRRALGAIYFFVLLPLFSFVLLRGAPPIGISRRSHRFVGWHSGDYGGGHGGHRCVAAARHPAGARASFQIPLYGGLPWASSNSFAACR